MKALFVCLQNLLRSPTAEKVFSGLEGLEVRSAGLGDDAMTPLTDDLIVWADTIFVMENSHLNKLCKKFKESIRGKDIRVLGISDDYEFMQPELVDLLKMRVTPLLPRELRESAPFVSL